jgi:hypothetical protein
LAAQFGAKKVVGVDNHIGVISSAIRINSYFAAPINFVVHDLNEELIDIEPADTVFCFLSTGKMKNRANFIKTILRTTKNVLYFALPAQDTLLNYQDVINEQNFSLIEKISISRDMSRDNAEINAIYRCVISNKNRSYQEARRAAERL